MCLLFILFTNTILFSLFPISPCALSVNSDKIKDSVISPSSTTSTSSSSSSSSSSKISSIEGSGSVPANEILSDDEDFFSGSSSTAIDFSGDGSLDSIVHNTNTNNHNGHTIVTDPGNHIITSNTDDTSSSNHGDDDTKDEDDEEDEGDDDDGDGDGDDLDGSEDDSEDDGVGVGRRGEGGGGGGGVEGDNHNHPLEGDNDAAESDNHDQSLDHHHPSIISNDTSTLNNVNNYDSKQDSPRPVSILVQPSMLAAVIGGIVVSLLCAILLAMFIIYRTRKKDEGSYICEPSLTSPVINHYGKASCNKFYDP